MYVFEFLKRMFRKSNTTVVIYLIINYILISAIIGLLFSGGGGIGILLGFVVGLVAYIISLALALSPVGEWLLRLQCQCHPIEKLSPEWQNSILPIFQEVYQQARREDSSIAPDIKLYYTENEDENAFALGRKTIAVTTGGLQNPMFREQLKGILGHEFGHLAHKDTDLLLLITVGNMIITIGITILKIIILAATFLFNAVATIVGWLSHGDRDHGICVFFLKLGTSIASFLSLVFINLFMRLWTKIGQLLVMKGSRENEYEADAFACLLGYGRELYSFFQSMALSVLIFRIELSLKSWISIALTTLTKKPASFRAKAIGRQYIPVCSITTRISPPMLRSVFVSSARSSAVCRTTNGIITISPPGLRTATVLFPLETSIPTAVISFLLIGSPPTKKYSIGDRSGSLPIQLA